MLVTQHEALQGPQQSPIRKDPCLFLCQHTHSGEAKTQTSAEIKASSAA